MSLGAPSEMIAIMADVPDRGPYRDSLQSTDSFSTMGTTGRRPNTDIGRDHVAWVALFVQLRHMLPSALMRTAGLSLLFFGLLLLGCQNAEGPPLERRAISTEAAPDAIGPYSQGIQVGNRIYCSGQIGLNPQTGALVEGGIKAETQQTLDNLEAVLHAAGASLNDVVQVQVFLKDLDDYDAMNEVYGTYFEEVPPARAATEADSLPAGARVEIMATAEK